MNQKILVLYHYYHPDDMAGAVIFTDFCEGLAKKGRFPGGTGTPKARASSGGLGTGDWEVEVWPSNRACHHPASYPLKPEIKNGVLIRRVWRPSLPQNLFFVRVLNSLLMLKLWWLRLAFTPSMKPDIILIGSDPFLSIMLVPFLKFLRPKAKIVHWCFVLFPEAAEADRLIGKLSPFFSALMPLVKRGYSKCDLAAGMCPSMKERLEQYPVKKTAAFTPWALVEPAHSLPYDMKERIDLFGNCHLGLLYSGSFGRPHDFYLTLKLARLMVSQSGSTSKPTAVFTYGVQESHSYAIKLAVNPEDTNIRLAGFAPKDKLAARLSAADIHLVSLRSEWNGMMAPAKFFGALAVGRPILFEGSAGRASQSNGPGTPKTRVSIPNQFNKGFGTIKPSASPGRLGTDAGGFDAGDSCIAKWIEEYQVGWVLRYDNLDEIAETLRKFSRDHAKKADMFRHCHKIYKDHFSKRIIIEQWDKELRSLF